jgi:hypothetical protein
MSTSMRSRGDSLDHNRQPRPKLDDERKPPNAPDRRNDHDPAHRAMSLREVFPDSGSRPSWAWDLIHEEDDLAREATDARGTESVLCVIEGKDVQEQLEESEKASADDIVEGLFKHGMLHALTGHSDTGKTTILLCILVHVSAGIPLGDLKVKRGNVLFIAGERQKRSYKRYLAACKMLGLDHRKINFTFIDGRKHGTTLKISKTIEHFMTLAEQKGGFSLIVVDTSLTFYEGDDEDHTVDMQRHAELMASLTEVKGKPAVIAVCHPTKGATGKEQMTPRGASSFYNKIDVGNTCMKVSDGISEIHYLKNQTDNPYDPIRFKVTNIEIDLGKGIEHVAYAEPVSAGTLDADDEALLAKINVSKGASVRKLAEALNWDRSKLYRQAKELLKLGLIEKAGEEGFVITDAGKSCLKKA